MIRECKVLFYNRFLNILVFDFNNKQIQTTAELDTECKTVFVRYKDGKYEIVSREEYEKFIRKPSKKKEKDIVCDFKKDTETNTSEL